MLSSPRWRARAGSRYPRQGWRRSPHPPLPSRPSPAKFHGRSSHGTAAPDKSSSRDSVPYLVWMQQKGPRAPPDSAVRVRQPRGSGLCFAVRPPARASVAGVIASLGQSGADERPHPSAAPEATLPGLATKATNVMDDRALCVISWGAWATEIAPAERRRRSRKIEYLIHFCPCDGMPVPLACRPKETASKSKTPSRRTATGAYQGTAQIVRQNAPRFDTRTRT